MPGKFRAEGNSIDYTPLAAVAAGTVVQIGTQYVGLANNSIPANTKGALAIAGTFQIDANAALGSGAAQGSEVGIDVANQEAVVQGTGDFNLPVAETMPGNQAWVRVQLRNQV